MAEADVEAPRYRAFISYSHRDAKVARWLHNGLETYRVPRAMVGRSGDYGEVPRRLRPVFRDEEELPGAAELGPKLETALKASAALIVICSQSAARSQWVDREIRLFRSVNPDRPVLAMIAAGTPGSDQECFPKSLLHGVTASGEIDHAVNHEPLAPDLQKLDKEGVKLKLIAGLLGVGYGELARRDLKRAHRQIVLFGALGAAVTLALVVLSVVALTYAQMAIKQRNIAEHNADEAERKAWLANVAADEVRHQADLLKADKTAVCSKIKVRPKA